eukprot:1836363-Prymnesium_polylepis.1
MARSRFSTARVLRSRAPWRCRAFRRASSASRRRPGPPPGFAARWTRPRGRRAPPPRRLPPRVSLAHARDVLCAHRESRAASTLTVAARVSGFSRTAAGFRGRSRRARRRDGRAHVP